MAGPKQWASDHVFSSTSRDLAAKRSESFAAAVSPGALGV